MPRSVAVPVPVPARRARALALGALLLLGACSSEIGLEEEAEMGADYAAQITQQVRLIRDPVAVEALNLLGRTLAEHADSTGRRYTFYLVDSPEVNAFAVPGGHIFVNRGLVEQADRMFELAGVLGHEIGHVTERHGLQMLEKERNANLLLTLLYTLLGREPGPLEQVAIQGGGSLVFAKYGRDAERAADSEAVETLVAAGIDPEGIATFFEEMLAAQQRDPTPLDEWFSTHPTSAERVRNARALIEAYAGLDRDRLVRDTRGYQRFRERVQAGTGAMP